MQRINFITKETAKKCGLISGTYGIRDVIPVYMSKRGNYQFMPFSDHRSTRSYGLDSVAVFKSTRTVSFTVDSEKCYHLDTKGHDEMLLVLRVLAHTYEDMYYILLESSKDLGKKIAQRGLFDDVMAMDSYRFSRHRVIDYLCGAIYSTDRPSEKTESRVLSAIQTVEKLRAKDKAIKENRQKIYFGAPLFSNMEKEYNEKVVQALRIRFKDDIEIYLPQENESINDKSGYANSTLIAKADTEELLKSDVLIAVLDGPVIDVGLASEIGVAYQAGIPIIGLYTDSRQGTFGNQEKIKALDELAESQFSYANLYTIGLIKLNGEVFSSEEDVTSAVEHLILSKEDAKCS